MSHYDHIHAPLPIVYVYLRDVTLLRILRKYTYASLARDAYLYLCYLTCCIFYYIVLNVYLIEHITGRDKKGRSDTYFEINVLHLRIL